MGKDKIRRFSEIGNFPNVLQLDEGKALKGSWAAAIFNNNNPIVLELACGKGEYALAMAKMFPDKNFIGIDYKGNRIWKGARTALDQSIKNLAFLRIQIESISEYFAENEVSEIWITFPDPQPQLSRIKKRLTSPRFLVQYRLILIPGAQVHLKTDNDMFYQYTLDTVRENNLPIAIQTDDLYSSPYVDTILSIKTYYEEKYLVQGKSINYLKFSFDNG